MADRDELARSFGDQVTAYEAARPGYPREAVDWALEPINAAYSTIVDVGAGTGKLTRVLVATGAEVIAVDPDAEMELELMAQVPGVETYLGTGESLPLPDASADAITYGQAWHWVDPERAAAEAVRVLHPGGVLALLWNELDRSTPWVGRYRELLGTSPAEAFLASLTELVLPEPFGGAEERRFGWSATIGGAGLLDLARSRPAVMRAEPGVRERIEEGIRALADELGLAGGATVELPYVTRAFRVVRP